MSRPGQPARITAVQRRSPSVQGGTLAGADVSRRRNSYQVRRRRSGHRGSRRSGGGNRLVGAANRSPATGEPDHGRSSAAQIPMPNERDSRMPAQQEITMTTVTELATRDDI